MQAEIKERLQKSGIDVSDALERFMGNDAFLERFLKKFLSDSNYENLAAAIETGDKEAALIAAHTLKGICGNLSMTGLFELLSKQVVAFRAGDWEKGAEMMPEITNGYEAVVEAIRCME